MPTYNTYNTYEEAKIANPESVIYEFEGYFSLFKGISSKECSPADYCMTVEKLLDDGHKFVEGDVYLNIQGDVRVVNSNKEWIDVLNGKSAMDNKRYILRAAALEEKPKPTKFVKVEESIFDLKGEFERGELYMWLSDGYLVVPNETQLSILLDHKQCYRQVEIDWRDEVAEFTGLGKDFYTWVDCIDDMYNFNFVGMCHLVASLTEKPTN